MFGYGNIHEVRERGVSGLSISEDGYTKQRAREDHQRVAESGEPEIYCPTADVRQFGCLAPENPVGIGSSRTEIISASVGQYSYFERVSTLNTGWIQT